MFSKNELKETTLLLQKKYRREKSQFIVEGRKLVLEALDSGYQCDVILSTNHFKDSNVDFFNSPNVKSVRTETIKQIELEKLSDTKTPQGVLGIFKITNKREKTISSKKIIALENISDPGNLGTILRNCDWFGFSNIVLSNNCAEIYNPKVIRSSAGSVFHLDINIEEDFYELLKEYQNKNYKITCSDLNGENLNETKIPERFVIVFCNEGNGPTKELISISDSKITIKGKGNAESLNVASASAVILAKYSG